MKAENQISAQVTGKKKRLKASFKIKLPAGIFYENKQKSPSFSQNQRYIYITDTNPRVGTPSSETGSHAVELGSSSGCE